MALFGSELNWYTDIFSVYRNIEETTNGLTTASRKLISKDNKGRIYRRSSPSINRTNQGGQYTMSDNLACPISVDIREGDEIRVIRGYLIGKNTNKVDVYIAGKPADYYVPFGGITPDLEHKQVVLESQNISGAEYVLEDSK